MPGNPTTKLRVWEHLVSRVPNHDLQEQMNVLNDLGAEGWELVAVIEGALYMKRQLGANQHDRYSNHD